MAEPTEQQLQMLKRVAAAQVAAFAGKPAKDPLNALAYLALVGADIVLDELIADARARGSERA